MKQLLIFLTLITCISIATAQVGINTKDIKGIFHIDATADNPTSGTVSATRMANDIIVDNEGNIGVGTHTPSARLHLKGATTGSAFRLTDGTEGSNKILLGDKDGHAWWGMTKGLGGYIVNLAKSAVSYTNGTARRFPINTYNNEISISNDGNYAVMLRCNTMLMQTGTSSTNTTVQRSRQVNVRYQLIRVRSGVSDVVCQTVETNPLMQMFDYTTLYISLRAANIKKDDSLYVNITFLGNADSDSAKLYMLLDYNNPNSTYSNQAFEMGAVIFYQL